MDLRHNRKDKFGISPGSVSSCQRLNEDNYQNLFATNLPGAVDENNIESVNLYESTDNCETNTFDSPSDPIVIHDETDYTSIIWMLLLISIFVAGVRFLIY